MLDIVRRAWQRVNLTPEERAAMKAAEGMLVTAIIAALSAATSYLGSNGQTVNVNAVLSLAGGAFLMTVWSAVKKYLSAQTDAPLAPANDAKTPSTDPAPAPPAPAPLPAE
jgi:hypothetical protein